jgi:serine protease Do
MSGYKRVVLQSALLMLMLGFNDAIADNKDDVYRKVSDSIYEVYAVDKDKQTILSLGSAVAITKHYLATNCHVALAGNFLIVNVNDKPYLARLCYYNQADDLCIVDVVGLTLSPVKIRASKNVTIGEDVFAVGNPEGKLKVISQGVINKIIVKGNSNVILRSTAESSFGSSGGGLFDKDANLIGITTGGVPDKDVSYSVPTELILEVIDPAKAPSCKLPSEPVSG